MIETIDGVELGQHSGLMYHTIGQRQGLGIGGLKNASEEAWYVLAKDLQRNVLIVGQGNEHPWLFSRTLLTREVNWINPIDLQTLDTLSAKVRYRQSDQACRIEQTADGYLVTFEQPQRAVTLGQSIVFYNGDVCLGGGVIEACSPWDAEHSTTMTPLQEQITALGGVFQAAALVDKLAHSGQVSDAALAYMLKTLLVRNPETTLDVYGGDDLGLRDGYKLLLAVLERETNNLPRESLRYVVSMLSLERQFSRRDDLLEIAALRIPKIEQQVELYGISSDTIASSFGSLYQDTISTFKQRIQVHGDMRFLQQEATAAKVRALLFAGIRSARLWRQLGGRRWHLLTKRGSMLSELRARNL